MKKRILPLIITYGTLLISVSCDGQSASMPQRLKPVKKSSTVSETGVLSVKRIAPEQLAELVYPEKIKPVQVVQKPAKPQIVKKDVGKYKIVAEWMVNGVRWVKVCEEITGIEHSFREDAQSGDIKVVGKNLMSYTLDIDGVMVEVAR